MNVFVHLMHHSDYRIQTCGNQLNDESDEADTTCRSHSVHIPSSISYLLQTQASAVILVSELCNTQFSVRTYRFL